jgi:probable phosphoglycerate mutase
LNARGRTAAADLAANLASLELAAVYTSPIQRCRETASILAGPHGIRPRTRKGIIEVDYGDWTGRGLKSLYRLKAWRSLMADPVGFRFPNGETLDEVRRRSLRSIEMLAARHGEETVMAVSHGDVIRSIVAHSLTGSVERIHRLHVAPLGVTVVSMAREGPPFAATINAPRL